MKLFTYLSLVIFMLPFLLIAQTESGEVQYNETINLHKRIPPEREQFKEMIPEFRTFARELFFTSSAAVYQSSEREIPGQETPSGRGGFRMRMAGVGGGLEAKVFTNLEEGSQIDQRDLFDKRFIVSTQPKTYQWKLSMEEKDILGHRSMKAVHEDTAQKIVAWFAVDIPVSAGPGRLSGLPGLILEADYNDGERVVKVVEIDNRVPDAETLAPPTKGKEVTEEEFNEIRREKMKEMRELYGRPGRRGPGGNPPN